MNKQFIFKRDNIENWDNIRENAENEMFTHLGKELDFQIEIKPLNLRSKSALKAYWVLIGSIVKWDANNNGYKQRVWNEWFKIEAGLIEIIDLMPFWKMKYNNKYKSYKLDSRLESEYGHLTSRFESEYSCNCTDSCDCPLNWKIYFIPLCQKPTIELGERYYEKTRSISNKGDVTKEEMERLINCVLKFGAENNVPNCEIINTELDKLLEFYNE